MYNDFNEGVLTHLKYDLVNHTQMINSDQLLKTRLVKV